MKLSAKNTEFVPLLGALKKIQFWLESNHPPQIMLAAQTMEEFKSQKLPAHCKVTRRKIHGPRVPVRGRRQISQSPKTLARWPKDGLVEGLTSTLVFMMNGEADIRIADYLVRCRQELRYWNFASLIHGARGMMYWSYLRSLQTDPPGWMEH